jgi:hypothetical protein
MSASGFPGRRVAAMRAGMMTTAWETAIFSANPVPNERARTGRIIPEFTRLYGLQEAPQTGYLCAAILVVQTSSNLFRLLRELRRNEFL